MYLVLIAIETVEIIFCESNAALSDADRNERFEGGLTVRTGRVSSLDRADDPVTISILGRECVSCDANS